MSIRPKISSASTTSNRSSTPRRRPVTRRHAPRAAIKRHGEIRLRENNRSFLPIGSPDAGALDDYNRERRAPESPFRGHDVARRYIRGLVSSRKPLVVTTSPQVEQAAIRLGCVPLRLENYFAAEIVAESLVANAGFFNGIYLIVTTMEMFDPGIYKIWRGRPRPDLFCGCISGKITPATVRTVMADALPRTWDRDVPPMTKLVREFLPSSARLWMLEEAVPLILKWRPRVVRQFIEECIKKKGLDARKFRRILRQERRRLELLAQEQSMKEIMCS